MSKKDTGILSRAMKAANPPAPSTGPIKKKPFSSTQSSTEPVITTGLGRFTQVVENLDEGRELLVKRAETAERKNELLSSRVESLEAEVDQWHGVLPIRRIDPKLIRRSKYANRHEAAFQSASFAELKADIAASKGNVQPIKVRVVGTSGGVEKYEIVYGHRRHQACLELGFDVQAIVEELDAEAHFLEMLRENQARQDLSPYEFGLMYQQAKKVFDIKDSRILAQRLSVSESQISRALKLVDLPQEVISAFHSPLDLQYKWASSLSKALKFFRDAVIDKARSIADLPEEERSKLTPNQILQALVAAGELGQQGSDKQKGEDAWRPVARTRAGDILSRDIDGCLELRIPSAAVSDQTRAELVAFLEKFAS